MATRTSSNLTIASFAGYYNGWVSKSATDNSGYYFGKGSQYGPLCIKFKIPLISNFLNRNPTVTFSFKANGVGYYTTCSFTATIRNSNYSSGSKSAQGTAVSNAVNQSSNISASSFVSITTSPITITGSSVKADNSTYYYCWFTNPDGNYQVKEITGKVYYDQYTQCSAPTSVKFEYNSIEKTSPYTHPSDNGTSGIKIKWSGAKAGAGMQIKGYKIQRYDSDTESWNKHDTIVNSSTTSCALAEGKRGEIRTYRIITLGTVSGYDSAASSMVYIYFNSKPSKPSAKDIIVSSNTTSTYIPITIPITNYSFKTNTRTMKLWWKASENSEWINSGKASRTDKTWIYDFLVESIDTTLAYGDSKTYWFKMVDNFGDESDEITVTLTRSVPLEVSSFTATLTSQSEGEMWVSFYTDTSAHKDSIKIELMSGIESIARVIIPWKDSMNLLTEGPEYNGSMELTYKFTLNVSDDFGDSASKEAATYLNSGDTIEQDITIGALPNDVILYNTLEENSIEIIEVGELRYFDKIRAQFDANTLMTSNATLYIGESTIGYDAKLSTDASALTFSLNRDEILNKLTISALKGRIEFSFSLGTKIKNSFSKTIYFSPRPSISITPPSPTFGMYSQSTGTFQINGNFSGFGLKDISISGGIDSIAPLQYKAENLDPPDTNGYKIEGFNLADLFPLTGFNAESRKGTIIKRITLKATNVLGVTRTAGVDVTLDFRKTPDNIKITTITYGDGIPSNLGELSLCEGTKIQVPFTYTSYGGDTIHFAVYWNDVEKASTTVTPMKGEGEEKTVAGAETILGEDGEYSLSFTVPSIPFGKTTANIVVKANLVNSSADPESSNLMTPKVSPYEDPGMNVLGSVLDNSTLTLNCSLNVQGKGTYNYNLQFDENSVWITKMNQNSPSPFIFETPPTTNQVARIEVTYTYPNNTTRVGETIESYSNTFVIFAASPTVSYRKNYLGINNTTPAEDTVIDINSFANRNKIKFSSPTEAIIELIASSDGPQLIFTKKVNNGNDIIYTLIFD